MKIKTQKLPRSQVKLEVELEPEEMKPFLDEAAKLLSKKPNAFDEKALYDRASRIAVKQTLLNVVEKEGLEPIAYLNKGVVVEEIGKEKPFRYVLEMAVYPQIKLADYKGIEVKKNEIDVKDKERIRQEALEKIVKDTELEVPAILQEEEEKGILEEFRGSVESLGNNFEEYLERTGKSMRDVKKEIEQEAERKVKLALILKEIAKKEKIEVSDDEVEARMQEILLNFGSFEEAQKAIDMQSLRNYIRLVIRNEKAIKAVELSIVFI